MITRRELLGTGLAAGVVAATGLPALAKVLPEYDVADFSDTLRWSRAATVINNYNDYEYVRATLRTEIDLNARLVQAVPRMFQKQSQTLTPSFLYEDNGITTATSVLSRHFRFETNLTPFKDPSDLVRRITSNQLIDEIVWELSKENQKLLEVGKRPIWYILVVCVPTVDQNTFQPKIAYKTRYGVIPTDATLSVPT